MHHDMTNEKLQQRLAALERGHVQLRAALRWAKGTVVLLGIVASMVVLSASAGASRTLPDRDQKRLRVRELTVVDDQDNPRAQLLVDKSSVTLTFFDTDKQALICISGSEKASGFTTYGKTGETGASLMETADATSLFLRTATSKSQFVLQAAKAGTSSFMMDPDGNGRVECDVNADGGELTFKDRKTKRKVFLSWFSPIWKSRSFELACKG